MGEPQYPFDKPRWQRVPKTSDAIRTLHREQMLPAIFFIFSRVACDENAARLAAADSVCLTSPEERMLIQAEVDKLRLASSTVSATHRGMLQRSYLQNKAQAHVCAGCRRDQPEAVKESLIRPLLSGLASHHAGLLPGWKGLVEGLFQQGMLRLIVHQGIAATCQPNHHRCWQLKSGVPQSEQHESLLPGCVS